MDSWLNGLCRCCHSEGIHKNLGIPYYPETIEEIYAHMFRETFNIIISPLPREENSSMYSICDLCISKLREAATFKNQVMQCEQSFMNYFRHVFSKDDTEDQIVKQETTNFFDNLKLEIESNSVNAETYQHLIENVPQRKTRKKSVHKGSEFDCQVEEDLQQTRKEGFKSEEFDDMPLSELKKKKEIDLNSDTNDDLIAKSRLSDGTYNCPICRKHIKKDTLKRHLIKHERPTFPCTYCKRVFQQEDLRKKHLATHTGDRVYDCDKKFKDTSNLSRHKKIVHAKSKLHTCQICTRSFSNRSHLVRHNDGNRCKKPSDTPLQCEVCNKIFKTQYLLKSHIRKHSTEKPFKCDICNMDFKYKATLERHMYIHIGTKNFVCKFCHKSYTHGAILRIHLRIHTGEKPFTCSICNKLFSHKHNMERHKARHDKPKLTTCTICNKIFPRESRLIYHMRSHTKEQPFPCKVCPKKYTDKRNVIKHYQRKHPNQVYDCRETDASVAKNLWKGIQDQQIRVFKKRIHERNLKKYSLLKEKPPAPEVVHIKVEKFEEAINNAESVEVISSEHSRDDSFDAFTVKQ